MITSNIVDLIANSKTIGITCHISADGDSLGSMLALMIGLRKVGKNAYIISKEAVSDVYKFLPESGIINGECSSPSEFTDCVIAVDCGNFERLSGFFDGNKKNYVLINLDHHLSNNMYGDLNYVDTKASAVGEVVYELLKNLSVPLDKDMAVCLYTAIMTDCGSFRYSNTTAATHSIAGDLISTGIDFSEIYRNIYENKKYKNIKLAGKVIDSMKLLAEGKLCLMELNMSMLNELQMEIKDTAELIAFGMQIDTVEVAVLFKEFSEGTKVSLRSKSNYDVRKIAETFGGGGHTKAAGFAINKSITEAEALIISLIEKELI